MIPKHFSLIKEHPQSYEIHDRRDGNRFHVAKNGIDLGMHGELSKIQRFDDGGTVEAKPRPTLGSIINYPGADKTVPAPKPRPVQNLAEGGSIPENVGPADPNAIPYETLIPQAEARAAREDVPYGTAPASPAPVQAQEMPTAPASAPAPAQPGAGDPLAIQAQQGNQALGAERQALLGGAEAESTEGKQTAEAYAKYAEKLDQQLTPQQIYQNHKSADDQLFKSYMNKTVDPDHYWKNQSVPSRISAGLGMILGGIGAGMTGGPNYAMQTINSAIERDIDAQKNDQSKTMNLWKMNREATQDETQANLATQNQMLAGVKAKALQFAAQAQGPMAQARLAPAIAQIDQQMNMNNFRRGMLSATAGGQVIDADPSLLLQTIPQHQQAEASKEIANAQKMKMLHDSVEQNVRDLKGKFLNGLFSPNDRKSAIDSFASQMDVLSDHRFNLEASQMKGHAFFPSPTDSAETILNKDRRREEFFRDFNQAPVFKGATGVGLDRFKSTSIPVTHTGRNAPQTQTMNGVTYIKVPGGWQKAA